MCKWNQIPNKKEILEGLDTIKGLLSLIQENSMKIKTYSSSKSYDEEFKMFSEMFSTVDQKANFNLNNI